MHVRRSIVVYVVAACVALSASSVLFGSDAAGAATSQKTTATAKRNAGGTVTLTVKITGKTNGGACKIEFVSAKAQKPGYKVCIAKKHGKFTNDGTWKLRTAKKYSKSSIRWKIVDPVGDTEYGPKTTKVKR